MQWDGDKFLGGKLCFNLMMLNFSLMDSWCHGNTWLFQLNPLARRLADAGLQLCPEARYVVSRILGISAAVDLLEGESAA